MKALITLLILIPLYGWGQTFTLSPASEVSVITCGPSQEELYTAFGHSAIRVHDPLQQYDAVYNYGVFDFRQPNFYLNFAKGFLYYRLGVYDYQAFEAAYIYDNRFVHEQVLHLTQEEKQRIFDYLQNNARPENQQYRYDYFYNNCATKIRDVVEEALGKDVVRFDGSYINTSYTIRQLTDLYLEEQPWGDLGIDICLGLPMDKVASPYEYMFLPDYIESSFDNATIARDGQNLPIVKKKNMIYVSRSEEEISGLPHPLLVFGLLLVVGIILTVIDLRRLKISFWFDALLFGATGLIGLLLLFLWTLTDHQAAARNFNLLWAFPVHLVAVIAFIKKPSWLQYYFAAVLVLSALTLISWQFLPQQLHFALIPIVALQGIRAYAQYRIPSKLKRKNYM